MLTLESCAEYMATARSPERGKPMANNTRLYHDGDGYRLKLHATNILFINGDGTYTYNAEGWETITTQQRLNEFGPLNIRREKGEFRVWKRGGDYVCPLASCTYASETASHGRTEWGGISSTCPKHENHYLRRRVLEWKFTDGMKCDAFGDAIGEWEEIDPWREHQRRRFDRAWKKYVDGFIAGLTKREIPRPSNGDCFYCGFMANKISGLDLPTPRVGSLGRDGTVTDYGPENWPWHHVISHMRERYHVPSLLGFAILLRRPGSPAFVADMIWHEGGQHASMALDYLRYMKQRFNRPLLDAWCDDVRAKEAA